MKHLQALVLTRYSECVYYGAHVIVIRERDEKRNVAYAADGFREEM
jgi:hypothetical protein